MIDFFCEIYSKIEYEKPVSSKIKYDSFLRLFIRFILNILAPIYFLSTRRNPKYRTAILNKEDSPRVVVSITTFPARINRIWLVVECILRQSYKPDRVLLWLSREQFTSIDSLPEKLTSLRKRGLEIVLCDDDLRSHKKYFYTFKRFPKSVVITVDDDFFYPSTLIQDLIDLNKEFPTSICCDRGFKMKKLGDIVLPYNKWEYLKKSLGPSFDVFQTSGGGTLYPPNSLSNEVFNEEVFMKYCPNADDIWLNLMSQMNHTKIVKTNCNRGLIPVINYRNRNLSDTNVHGGENDEQLEAVRNYYIQRGQVDPLANFVSL